MNITPFHNSILLEPLNEVEKTTKGAYISNSNEKSNGMRKGKILKLGYKVEQIINEYNLDLKVGDVILHLNNTGTQIMNDGKKLFFLEFQDIKAKIQ